MPKSDQTISGHKMELLDKKENVKTEIVTYRFAVNEETMLKVLPPITCRFYQIFFTLCASLSCLPFGLMLGWPSPTNPILIDQLSPIPITIDQSAMIAGFLMIGNAVGTPISNKSFVGTKFGILIGLAIMITGWVLMWQSRNIFWLLGSRFLVGFGNAYGTGQLKTYIGDTCDQDLKLNLIKCINVYVYLGIIIIFSVGPFIDFRDTSIACLSISIVIFFIILFLPRSPSELINDNKNINAKKQNHNVNINKEIFKISDNDKSKQEQFGLFKLFADADLRVKFLIFAGIVFCQQFSGAPATIIYTQILFTESQCPYPQYLAIAYVVIFFICNVLGIYLMPKFNKRIVLLCSTFSVILLIIAKILVVYFEMNVNYWSYSSFVVLCLFIIAHTLGLGNIPFTLIPDLFPGSYRTTVTHFFIAFHSILALVITKIFQVLMTQYDVSVPFYLFLSISILALLLIYFVIPNKACEKVHVIDDSLEKNVEINVKPIN